MSGHAKRVPEASVHPDPAENYREIFECTHLIFTVSGRGPNKQAYTCVRNAVTLVWGSLRFAPIMYPICLFLCCCYCKHICTCASVYSNFNIICRSFLYQVIHGSFTFPNAPLERCFIPSNLRSTASSFLLQRLRTHTNAYQYSPCYSTLEQFTSLLTQFKLFAVF